MFAHLHTRSWFSFLAGGSSPEALAAAAQAGGMSALALTDRNGVYGAVRFQKACRERGVKSILGAEVTVDGAPLVLLARNHTGYANINKILSEAHLEAAGSALPSFSRHNGNGAVAGPSGVAAGKGTAAEHPPKTDRANPQATLDALACHRDGIICLTGGRDGRLWQHVAAFEHAKARTWLKMLARIFEGQLYVELAHYLRPGDSRVIHALYDLAKQAGLPVVATGDVRYAVADDYRRYDLLTCIRLGITVFEPHPERPVNDESWLKPESRLRRLIPYPEAFRNAAAIAERCNVNLVPGYITPPGTRLPEGVTGRELIRNLCREALDELYPGRDRSRAVQQLEKELDVILSLQLEEFFLVVREVVAEAHRRNIRCAGRGSAANSIVAYLLGITSVDPLKHNLLFERFLHGGRKGTPDIDVDFDAERREEIIAWIEQRFGIEQTAMTGTLITYRLRSALRETAKALGWPLEIIDKLTSRVPSGRAARVRDFRVELENVLGSSPLFEVLLEMVEGLEECPRHLGLHSGGMVLSRKPLYHFTPVQVSANGVKVVQFDKNDVEALGLVKLDVLGLRMMASVSEAVEMVARHEGRSIDIDRLDLGDQRVFNMIRAGKTIGCFQIESQGQLHLLAMHQPETFDDLITEIALFRPGPLQGKMVHPFVKRRRGTEPVTYDHPSLEPILKDTYGIILFQEQVLEVAHHFAGMSLQEADDFRSLMSRFRDPGEMEAMREKFVTGAMRKGVPEVTAHSVFDKVARFVGFGFCRSHAAAFAKTVYQSAWLKFYHPAAFMAALMQHRPGMYNQMTLEEEARRFGVETLLPDINRSGLRYDVERWPVASCQLTVGSPQSAVGSRQSANLDLGAVPSSIVHRPSSQSPQSSDHGRPSNQPLAIRKPLAAVNSVSADAAKLILWERMLRPFASVEDLYRRVPLDRDALDNLARSGALDELAGDSRKALWEVGVLARRLGPAGCRPTPALFDIPAFTPEDLPELPELTSTERLSWDYATHEAGRAHPMTLVRRNLTELEIRPIDLCYRLPRAMRTWRDGRPPIVTVAGIVTLRQRPPTAKGVMFVTIEDETNFLQCVVKPEVMEHLDHVVFTRSALIARGELHIAGNWRGLVLTRAWSLDGVFGGYVGYPSDKGGRDRWVRDVAPETSEGLRHRQS